MLVALDDEVLVCSLVDQAAPAIFRIANSDHFTGLLMPVLSRPRGQAMNLRVKQKFADTGWLEGREWSLEGVAEWLSQRAFTLFPAVRAFLER